MTSNTYYSAREGIVGDTVRHTGRFSNTLVISSFISAPTYRALATLRLCQGLSTFGNFGKPLLFVARILHRFCTRSAGIDLAWHTKIAPGMKFTHGFGTVVSPGATIGRNCTLFHGATLGRGDRILNNGVRITGYPILEDEVWVGPHAVIVGAVTIGKGSRLLAGVFVTEDIPAGSLVVGNPGKIVKHNVEPDVSNVFVRTNKFIA